MVAIKGIRACVFIGCAIIDTNLEAVKWNQSTVSRPLCHCEERQRRSNLAGGSAVSLTLGTSSTMSAPAERRHDPKGSHYMYEIGAVGSLA